MLDRMISCNETITSNTIVLLARFQPTPISDIVRSGSGYIMQSEITFLGTVSHPNLVKLLGYCCDDVEFLLVYEFMPKGSLETHLFWSMNFKYVKFNTYLFTMEFI